MCVGASDVAEEASDGESRGRQGQAGGGASDVATERGTDCRLARARRCCSAPRASARLSV